MVDNFEQHLAECKMRMYSHNTRAAAKAGVDLSTYAISSLDGQNVICTPIDQTGQSAA